MRNVAVRTVLVHKFSSDQMQTGKPETEKKPSFNAQVLHVRTKKQVSNSKWIQYYILSAKMKEYV